MKQVLSLVLGILLLVHMVGAVLPGTTNQFNVTSSYANNTVINATDGEVSLPVKPIISPNGMAATPSRNNYLLYALVAIGVIVAIFIIRYLIKKK